MRLYIKNGVKMKQLYFKHGNKTYYDTIPALYKSIINNPPEGYTFNGIIKNQKTPSHRNFAYKMLLLGRPYTLQLANKFRKESLPDVYCIFSTELLETDKPWICLYDNVLQFTQSDINTSKYQKKLEKAFTQESCKKILTWCDHNKSLMSMVFDTSKFIDKIDVLRPAVPKQDFKRKYDSDKFQILFMDTFRTSDFHDKGGKEVLLAFAVLRKKYFNVDLVIRSNIHDIDTGKRVKVYNKVLPYDDILRLYKESDLVWHPSWNGVNAMTPLESYSFELPVIGVEAWSNTEAIKDGVTGFLIPTDEKYPNNCKEFLKAYKGTKQYRFKKIRQEIVKGLVETTSKLIDDQKLRKKMGENGRKMVEEGRFSLKERNKKLKEILECH